MAKDNLRKKNGWFLEQISVSMKKSKLDQLSNIYISDVSRFYTVLYHFDFIYPFYIQSSSSKSPTLFLTGVSAAFSGFIVSGSSSIFFSPSACAISSS